MQVSLTMLIFAVPMIIWDNIELNCQLRFFLLKKTIAYQYLWRELFQKYLGDMAADRYNLAHSLEQLSNIAVFTN